MGLLRAKIGGFDLYFLLKSMGWENIFGPTPFPAFPKIFPKITT